MHAICIFISISLLLQVGLEIAKNKPYEPSVASNQAAVCGIQKTPELFVSHFDKSDDAGQLVGKRSLKVT